MITYDDLKHCAALAREARDRQERMERLRSMAERATSAPHHAPGMATPESPDRIGDWVHRLDEAQRACDEFCRGVSEHVLEVKLAFWEIHNEDQQEVLELRYIEGLTWDEISDKTHFSERWCRHLHENALDALGIASSMRVC